MEPSKKIACLKNLRRWFDTGGLADFSLNVQEGDYLVLLGPSGVGKTVLLEVLAGFLTPESGNIEVDGNDMTAAPIQSRPFSLVFQDQLLFPHLTVAANLGYGLSCRGWDKPRIRERVEEIAQLVGLGELLDRFPGNLSGGESQRVALGRALAVKPRLLLLDEPMSSLDIPSRRDMCALLRRINRSGQTCLHVTHDVEEALSVATRIGVMEKGRIIQIGAPEEVFSTPANEFVANLAGMRNFLRGTLQKATEKDVAGEFRVGSLLFQTASPGEPGPGFLMFRGEDVTLTAQPSESSACNQFRGTLSDFHSARTGLEVEIDIGIPVRAVITHSSRKRLQLHPGKQVSISIKATATKFLPAPS